MGGPAYSRGELGMCANLLGSSPMSYQYVVSGAQYVCAAVLHARRVDTCLMPQSEEDLRLVESDPVLHAIAEALS